ncbi:ShlB/FhaC/HecB family hemolysin secretion/activation protein [Falsiroseomonas sp. HW251]|uniref:ShlB/FhaC/HecB family hemolysin secretion/activation protein n=1 Tax=Falsiroseomonas sp. HW251 TaxID=3390998 RepID=UPI003D3218B6
MMRLPGCGRARPSRRILALPLLLLASPAAAQAPPPLPGAIERATPVEPPSLGPSLLPPEPQRNSGPGEARRVPIGGVAIQGNTALPEAALAPAVRHLAGGQPSLAEIEDARLAVLRTYREAGFPFLAVQAGLGPRPDGRFDLRFEVTEGRIAEVVLEGDIGPAARQARRFLDPLVGARAISNAELERALLLVSDIPGVTAQGVLRPIPDQPGALQLVVRLERRAVSGFLNLDNRGYAQTGAWQGLLVGQANSLTQFGERTEVSVLQTDGNGQSFLQVAEEVFIGGSGLRLRAWFGTGRALPFSPLAAIGYRGDTTVGGAALIYPVLRSRPMNLTATGQFDGFESSVETNGARQSRDFVRALRLTLDGAAQDAWLGSAPAAAATTWYLRYAQGLNAFGATGTGAALASRLDSDFGFSKVAGEVARLQPLFAAGESWLVSALGVVAGQWSDDILPPAEKFYLGGQRLGRGFYAGQVSGDRALGVTLELQASRSLDVTVPAGGFRLGTQLYLFRDGGRAWDNGPFGLDRSLDSWGGGVRLQFDERVQLDVEGVRRMTRNPDGPGFAELNANAVYARVLVRF